MGSKNSNNFNLPDCGSKVFVAMSGGVDSSVTAALLKERGFEVTGVHIKMWLPPAGLGGDGLSVACSQKQDRHDAMAVAKKLEIPFETWDFTKEYKKEVVDYLVREYAAGRTPNPDVMCNRHIKFGVFLKKALERGADCMATGHYARKREIKNQKSKIKNFVLMQARDLNKDQSYFLWALTQKQLKYCLFPIGEYTKPEVRAMAKKFGLAIAEKPDSHGICFVGEINIRNFLKNYIPAERGRVLTTAGKAIGEHEGLSFYTIGQREGLGIGGGIPYYVADKDFKTNTLLVGEGPYDEKLFKKEIVVAEVNWISGENPRLPFRCEARIRYRQPLQSCTIKVSMNTELHTDKRINKAQIRRFVDSQQIRHSLMVKFNEPQRAVTPGQSIVFYKNGEMLGGGIIDKVL